MAQLLEINQVGKREALLDFISNKDSHETPVLSMLPKGTDPANTLVQWQADNYRKPRKRGVKDGEDVTEFANKAQNRELLYGRMMKVRDEFAVGDIAENVSNVAGLRGKEYAASVVKSLVELKRDIEAVICGTQDSTAPAGDIAAVTRGIGGWISNSAQTDLPVPTAYRTPSNSINTTATASLTEANVNAVLKSQWKQTGKAARYVGVVGIDLKERFSTFTRYAPDVASNTIVRQYNANANDKKITNVVSVYEADGGTIELLPSNFIGVNDDGDPDDGMGYILNLEDWELRFNRMPRHKQLEDRGGGPKGFTDAIMILVCKNPLGSGKFDPA